MIYKETFISSCAGPSGGIQRSGNEQECKITKNGLRAQYGFGSISICLGTNEAAREIRNLFESKKIDMDVIKTGQKQRTSHESS